MRGWSIASSSASEPCLSTSMSGGKSGQSQSCRVARRAFTTGNGEVTECPERKGTVSKKPEAKSSLPPDGRLPCSHLSPWKTFSSWVHLVPFLRKPEPHPLSLKSMFFPLRCAASDTRGLVHGRKMFTPLKLQVTVPEEGSQRRVLSRAGEVGSSMGGVTLPLVPPRGFGGILGSPAFCSLCHLGCDNSPSLHLLICKFQINNICFTGVLQGPNEIM